MKISAARSSYNRLFNPWHVVCNGCMHVPTSRTFSTESPKLYSLKNIRRIRGLGGSGVTASIYRDGARVGWVQVPADGGTTLFTFDREGERTLFEHYVEHWWDTSHTQVSFELTALEFASNDPSFIPRLQAKLKYWVAALVHAATPQKKIRPAA